MPSVRVFFSLHDGPSSSSRDSPPPHSVTEKQGELGWNARGMSCHETATARLSKLTTVWPPTHYHISHAGNTCLHGRHISRASNSLANEGHMYMYTLLTHLLSVMSRMHAHNLIVSIHTRVCHSFLVWQRFNTINPLWRVIGWSAQG